MRNVLTGQSTLQFLIQKSSLMSKPPTFRKALALLLVFTVLFGPSVHSLAHGYDANQPQAAPASLTAADFAISADPGSLTIPVGTTSTSNITLTSLGGFSGPIVLSVSSPTLDASLNETETILSSGGTTVVTLSVLAPTSTAPHDYVVSVGGSSGCSLSHETQVLVTVTGPDFSLSAGTGLLVISSGGSDTSSIDLASLNGFSGPVTLYSDSSGLTSTLWPASLSLTAGGTGASNLTVSVPAAAQPGNYSVQVIAITSSLLHSIEITVIVPGAGFTVSADPFSLTVIAGGSSNSSVITITPFGAFSGIGSFIGLSDSLALTVALTSTSFTIPGGATSTLTLTADADTTPGIYSVTVIASSSSFSQSVDIPVIVKGSDFELSADPEFLAVNASGASCSSTISSTAIQGFIGTIALSESSFPIGLVVSLSTTMITGSGTSTVTVTAPAGTLPRLYYVTVQADSGPLTRYAPVIRVLVAGPDFTLSPDPDLLTISAGSSATSIITAVSLHGFNSQISLQASTTTTGTTASISPASLQGSGFATLTVNVDPSIVPGSYTVVVTGHSGPLSHTEFVSIDVTGPDFSIAADSYALTVSTASPGTSTITVSPLNGFTGQVSLSATATFNLNASIEPSHISGSGIATLSVNSTVPGSYTVILSGSSGLLFHSIIISVTVLGTDFILAVPASMTAPVGVIGNVVITVIPSGGFSDNVTLTLSVSPTALSCSLSSTVLEGGSGTTTLSCTGPNGTYTVTVTGTSGSAGPHSKTLKVTVADFSLSAGPVTPSRVRANSQGTSTITLQATIGFSGQVELSAQSTPSGLTCSLAASVMLSLPTETTTLSCNSSIAGDYTVTVTGTTGSPSVETTVVTFHVTDFILAVSPSSVSVNVGTSGTSMISMTGVNGFGESVDISYSVSPSGGLACTVSPSSLTGSGVSTLSCTSSGSGTFTVTVTVTTGSLSHTATVTITSPSSDFYLSSTPASLTVQAGNSGTMIISVTPSYGFSATVDLTAVATQSGLTFSLETSSVTGGSGTSTLTIRVDPSVPEATYTVTVKGTSGSLSHSLPLSIIVKSAPENSNILGLPPTTFYPIVVVAVVALIGAGLYLLRFRNTKRPA